jgi:hypothetical protein
MITTRYFLAWSERTYLLLARSMMVMAMVPVCKVHPQQHVFTIVFLRWTTVVMLLIIFTANCKQLQAESKSVRNCYYHIIKGHFGIRKNMKLLITEFKFEPFILKHTLAVSKSTTCYSLYVFATKCADVFLEQGHKQFCSADKLYFLYCCIFPVMYSTWDGEQITQKTSIVQWRGMRIIGPRYLQVR